MSELERLAELDARAAKRHAALQRELKVVSESLQLLLDDDPTYRQRVAEMRRAEGYARAFSDPSPLVTVLIPHFSRLDSLIGVAVPSALQQTHSNVEVLVVGDGIPTGRAEQVRAALDGLGDDRVRFENTTLNGPYPEDRRRKWLTLATAPLNHGLVAARGDWLIAIGDDDALRPDALERLVPYAQAERLEFAYGKVLYHGIGDPLTLGVFPPEHGQVGLQNGIFHAGLRCVPFESAQSLFNVPNDIGYINRLMRLGVRMGMLDAMVVDLYPSSEGHETAALDPAPSVDVALAEADARARAAEARAEAAEQLAAELAAARDWLAVVERSLSWRLTRPLRHVAAIRRRRTERRG